MIERLVAGTAGCVSLVVGGAGAVAAHQHAVSTSGAQRTIDVVVIGDCP